MYLFQRFIEVKVELTEQIEGTKVQFEATTKL